MNSQPTQFVVSVDTEEEGLWGGAFPVTGNTTENLQGLPRFQEACEAAGARPTYLIDAPVLKDSLAMSRLVAWQESNRCEIGAHCHPWCNPPLDETKIPSVAESYLCNLPHELQHAKLKWLTERIADASGRAPTSYRAGRYGFDRVSARILAELNYEVDSSVLPLHEYTSQQGPDFRMAGREPSVFDEHPRLLEIPVTAGFTSSGFERRRKTWISVRKPPWSRFRLAGVGDRLGWIRRVKLTPEGTRLRDLRDLIDACVSDGLRTLVLMLHSSSLVVGHSPYATSEADLDGVYDRLTGAIKHLIKNHGSKGVTLTEAARQVRSASPSEPSQPLGTEA